MKPSSVILDLLRTYPRRGTSVKAIMATGRMFGFSENLMRVNLSRLAARRIVENFKRAHYRLTDDTDPLNDFVEAWRLGENRIREWDGESWLAVHSSGVAAPKHDWALIARGFRPVADGLWMRPDNLASSRDEVEDLLHGLGMDPESVLFDRARTRDRRQAAWLGHFDIDAMVREYVDCRAELEQSIARLDDMPYESALRESFNLGGKAVHILAKDPLLPAAMIDTEPRRALWRAMLAYDQKGREIWGRRGKDRPETIPTPQLQISTGT